jgi:hypothetical protein
VERHLLRSRCGGRYPERRRPGRTLVPEVEPHPLHAVRPAAGLSAAFRPCYTAVAAAGQRADRIAGRLACAAIRPLVGDTGRVTLALDDTPTERYGRHVQGAGVHHNPAPGPAGSPYTCTGTSGWS